MQCEVLNGTWDEAEEAGAAARKPNVLWRANDSRDYLSCGKCPVVTEDAAVMGNWIRGLRQLSLLVRPHLCCMSRNFLLKKKIINLFFGVDLQCCVTFCCTANRVSSAYAYFPFSFGFPSHLGHHRALGRVPCVVQQLLLSFPILYSVGFPAASVGKESACSLQEWVAMPSSRRSS